MNLTRTAIHTQRTLVYDGPKSLQSASRAYRQVEKDGVLVELPTDREQLNFRNGAVVKDSLQRAYDRNLGGEFYTPHVEIISPSGEQRVVAGAILEPVAGDAKPAVSFSAFDTEAGVCREQWLQTLLPDGGCEFAQQSEWEDRHLLVSPDGQLTSRGFSEFSAPEGFETPRLVDGKILYNDYGDGATLEPAIPLEWLTTT